MFKIFKYILIANTYNRAKKNFIVLFASFMALILLSFILNDIINASSGVSVYILLGVKWLIVLLFLVVMGYNIVKIINIASTPFESSKISFLQTRKEKNDLKKEHILKKETLLTKSDLILKKYQGGYHE
jgi:hypothetical protein